MTDNYFIIFLAVALIHAAQSLIPKDCFRPNEQYQCGGACQTTCSTLNKTCPIVNVVCNDLCYCKTGYARDQTGTCVPISKCKDRLNGICGKNEEYREDLYINNECIPQLLDFEVENTYRCGCYCRPGYKRDPQGRCILEEDCPPIPPKVNCTGENEHAECGSPCQTECRTLGQECEIINKRCTDACYCDKGFARDATGKCVHIYECPQT